MVGGYVCVDTCVCVYAGGGSRVRRQAHALEARAWAVRADATSAWVAREVVARWGAARAELSFLDGASKVARASRRVRGSCVRWVRKGASGGWNGGGGLQVGKGQTAGGVFSGSNLQVQARHFETGRRRVHGDARVDHDARRNTRGAHLNSKSLTQARCGAHVLRDTCSAAQTVRRICAHLELSCRL